MKKSLRNNLICLSIILFVIFAVGLTSSYAWKGGHGHPYAKGDKDPTQVVRPEEIMKITQDLCDIAGYGNLSGLHPGSPRSDKAAAYIFRYLKKHGLKNVRMEPVELVDGFAKKSKMTVKVGAQAPIEISHVAMKYNATTPPEGIEGELAYVGFGNKSDFNLVDVSGKIALIDNLKFADTGNTLSTLGVFAAARSSGAIGVIIAEARTPVPRANNAGRVGTPALIPGISVGKPEGDYLRDLALSGTPHTVNIMVDGTQVLYTNHNIVAELEGNSSNDEIFLHPSHYSTMFTGTVDNLANVALNLGMAKYFARQPKASRNRDMVFLFSFGHDSGSNEGEEAFSVKYAEMLKNTIILSYDHFVSGLNHYWDETLEKYVTDGKDANRQIRATSDVLASMAMFLNDKYGFRSVMVVGMPSSGGNHSNYMRHGPAVLQPGMGAPYYYHTPDDTPDKVSVDLIRRVFILNVETAEWMDSTEEGYLFHADRNPNRLPFLPNTPPEINIFVSQDTLRVGDTLIVSLDEEKWDDDKACYLRNQQLPDYVGLTFHWGDGTPDSALEGVRGWNAQHVYQNPGVYTVTIMLTDSQGEAGTASRVITVLP